MRKFFLAITFGAFILGQPRAALAAGSIDSIATRAAAAVAPSQQALLVVAAPLITDQVAPHGDDLALRLATILAGKLGGAARAHPRVASLATARAAAGHSAGLVFVSAQIEKGELRATVDLYPVVANTWDRVRVTAPAPRAHGFASAPIDAEIRTFLPVVTLEQAQVHKAHHDETEVLAAACGDLDGDGGMEIALVSRARVAVGHVRGKIGEEKFTVDKFANWSALAPRVATPLREPIGGAAFDYSTLYVGTTDRGGVALKGNLDTFATLVGIPVSGAGMVACAKVDPNSSSFSGKLSACTLPPPNATHFRIGPRPAPDPRPERFDAAAVASVVDKSGVGHGAFASRDLDGKLVVVLENASRTFDDAGAQVAVGDLDQDGVAEIVTSRNTTDDEIDIWSYDGTTTRERKKIPAPDGVSALAICPPEANGVPALIAVVGSEVWIVR
ncbi:MAG: hypothetical protein ABI183_24305 [Polyangiaceae bacterium]